VPVPKAEAHDAAPADATANSAAGSPSKKDPAVELAELRDRWQRAAAETENLRKRYERQLAEERTQAQAQASAEWLPVLDNLELALQHAEADPDTIVAGVSAVVEQALAVLARLGFHRIDDVGVPFDPSRHEAAAVVDAPDTKPGTVVAVLRPGYAADGTLLRPAAVAVAGGQD
jgi:molecular chaperone GrpE